MAESAMSQSAILPSLYRSRIAHLSSAGRAKRLLQEIGRARYTQTSSERRWFEQPLRNQVHCCVMVPLYQFQPSRAREVHHHMTFWDAAHSLGLAIPLRRLAHIYPVMREKAAKNPNRDPELSHWKSATGKSHLHRGI